MIFRSISQKIITSLTVLIIIAVLILGCSRQEEKDMPKSKSQELFKIRCGITPYQDSALPVVPKELGWYKEEGLDVELVPVTWGDVVTALMSNSIDVAVYNFNSFLPPYENAAKGTDKPLFYAPFYLFKGQAIMIHDGRGFKVYPASENETMEQRDKRVVESAKQLKGKRIAVTEGTELEQIVLAALDRAGMSKNDVSMIHASPEDSLAAFLSGNIDAFAAGLTERVEARRHGGIELLTTADVMLPVIDGLITRESFAKDHSEILDKLVKVWFRTIRFMEADLLKNSEHIRNYLASAASTRYSPDEYMIAWSFNVFPDNPIKANTLFNNHDSSAFWKTSWDAVNNFLIQQKKIKKPVPYMAYSGEDVLSRLAMTEQ